MRAGGRGGPRLGGDISGVTLAVARKQRAVDARALDRQLAHDRDMRDLQHLRETLAPIVSRALDWDAFLSLHKALTLAGNQPAEEWKLVAAPLKDRDYRCAKSAGSSPHLRNLSQKPRAYE